MLCNEDGRGRRVALKAMTPPGTGHGCAIMCPSGKLPFFRNNPPPPCKQQPRDSAVWGPQQPGPKGLRRFELRSKYNLAQAVYCSWRKRAKEIP